MLHLRGSLIPYGYVEVWHDGDILPGEDWEKKIEENIAASDLFLVLLSIHSLTSQFIQKKELATALQRKSRIVPIMVRSCHWELHPAFKGLQGLPHNMKPVASHPDSDEAWTDVVKKLQELVESIRKEKAQPAPAPSVPPPPVPPAPSVPPPAPALPEWLPEMVNVQGGTFTMGCTKEQDGDCYSDEKPAHEVTLSDFRIGKYPVTQKLWKAVTGNNPSHFKGNDLPVENVFWDDCQAFIKKLNDLTGQQYRLPTEAEWDYAARGGRLSKGYKYAGSNNMDEAGWYNGNSNGKTHPVGQKKPNELGLYDMSGNVWEWCSDRYGRYKAGAVRNPLGPDSGGIRVYRGGSWNGYARYSRAATRGNSAPTARRNLLGFRLASQ